MENHVQDRTDRMGYSSAVNAIEISNHSVKRNLISTVRQAGGAARGALQGRNLVVPPSEFRSVARLRVRSWRYTSRFDYVIFAAF